MHLVARPFLACRLYGSIELHEGIERASQLVRVSNLYGTLHCVPPRMGIVAIERARSCHVDILHHAVFSDKTCHNGHLSNRRSVVGAIVGFVERRDGCDGVTLALKILYCQGDVFHERGAVCGLPCCTAGIACQQP